MFPSITIELIQERVKLQVRDLLSKQKLRMFSHGHACESLQDDETIIPQDVLSNISLHHWPKLHHDFSTSTFKKEKDCM